MIGTFHDIFESQELVGVADSVIGYVVIGEKVGHR